MANKKKFEGMAIVNVTDATWETQDHQKKVGVRLTPVAGQIPSQRLISEGQAKAMGLYSGGVFLIEFSEGEENEFGRNFYYSNSGKVELNMLGSLKKDLGLTEKGIVEVRDVTIEKPKTQTKEEVPQPADVK